MRTSLCAVVLAALAAVAAAQAPQTPQRREPPKPKNLQVLPADIPVPQLIAKMRYIAGSLGVECGFCHVRGDFSSDQKDTKLIARKMLKMVDTINKDNFDGREEVNCYTCHRGATHPVSQLPPKDSGSK